MSRYGITYTDITLKDHNEHGGCPLNFDQIVQPGITERTMSVPDKPVCRPLAGDLSAFLCPAVWGRLGLPDLDQSKASVIGSLRSPESQRGYRHAIDEFIDWYCSEPRLSFNRTVVLRYRIHLESRKLAAGTINVRLAAVRRLAYEAADAGLLSPELAAGIRRVKGVKTLGTRLGNWLSMNEARALWQCPDPETLKGKRDRAIIAVLLGC